MEMINEDNEGEGRRSRALMALCATEGATDLRVSNQRAILNGARRLVISRRLRLRQLSTVTLCVDNSADEAYNVRQSPITETWSLHFLTCVSEAKLFSHAKGV